MKSPLHLLIWGLFLSMATSSVAQTTLISENFSSGSLPAGWSNTSNIGGSQTWLFDDPDGRNISAGNFSGEYAILDSDYYGNRNSQDATLTSSSFNASGFTTINLLFDSQYREYSGSETCKVEVYNGSSWLQVADHTSLITDNYPGSTLINIDITSEAGGSANAKVRFTFTGNYDWWWAIDNLEIKGSGSGSSGGVSASTSPGGISTGSLALWLDANHLNYSNNDKVTTWSDLSSEANNAIAANNDAPTYKTNQMNGYPVVDFTKSSKDHLEVSNDNSLNPDKISIIVVGKYTSSSDSWAPFVIKCSDWDWDDGYGIARNNSNNSFLGYVNNYSSNRVSASLSTNSDNIITMVYDKNKVQTYYNGTSKGTDSYSSNINNSSNDLIIGASPNTSGTGTRNYLDGEIAEVILVKEDITDVERIILHNYLAAKYGISLSSSEDYYSQDNSGNGNFDHNVSGIGKASDGSSITVAKGTGIVTIEAETSLSNNDYLFWGENQIASDYSFSTDSDYMERLSSIWRVSTNNTPGAVTIAFDSASLNLSGMTSCAELKLAIANSSSFSGKTTYSLTYENGQYIAENVSFNNGDYFSLEYQDVIAIDQNGFTGGSGTNNAPGTGDECYKLLITSTANLNFNITENANVREMEVQAGGKVSIATNKFLVVTGNIVNNGTISVDENGSLVQKTTGTDSNYGSGTYEITRSGNTNSYIYNIWSSPISSAQLTTIFNDANPCDMWAFEKATQSWKYDFSTGYSTTCYGNSVTFHPPNLLSGGDGVMDVTRGYFIPGNLASARVYSGTVNNGDYTTSIVATALGNPGGTSWADDDWNLVGNPYPSGLSADSFWYENAILNQRITDALYFWDEADTNGGYNSTADYASWNLSGGVESGNSNQQPLGNIASGQGFWVVAKNNESLKFTNSMRVTSNNQFFKREENDQHNAWFRFTSPSGYKNNILVGYNSQSTDGIDDGYDAHKLVGNAHVRFASLISQDEFVIQSMAKLELAETKIVPLVVFTDESGMHTFSNYQRQLMSHSVKIYLVDHVEGVRFDLSTGDYSINLVANTTYDTRFQLEFENTITATNDGSGSKDLGGTSNTDSSNTTTNVRENLKSKGFSFVQKSNVLEIMHSDGFSGKLRILDITGKEVWSKRGIENAQSIRIATHAISSGIYLISISNGNQTFFTKKFVQP